MVDASGALGWAPASYLVPVDEEDIAEEKEENERLMSSMRGQPSKSVFMKISQLVCVLCKSRALISCHAPQSSHQISINIIMCVWVLAV